MRQHRAPSRNQMVRQFTSQRQALSGTSTDTMEFRRRYQQQLTLAGRVHSTLQRPLVLVRTKRVLSFMACFRRRRSPTTRNNMCHPHRRFLQKFTSRLPFTTRLIVFLRHQLSLPRHSSIQHRAICRLTRLRPTPTSQRSRQSPRATRSALIQRVRPSVHRHRLLLLLVLAQLAVAGSTDSLRMRESERTFRTLT
jgi:hypothetical protein